MGADLDTDPDARPADFGSEVRALIRSCSTGALASADRDREGWPHASLVLTAAAPDATPLLLVSDLAEHTRNIAADGRVSLLYVAEAGPENPLTDPLAGLRATVIGRAERVETSSDPAATAQLLARFLARHPSARTYAGFGDFNLYALRPDCAHVVAGFGRIGWAEWGSIRAPDAPALTAAEMGLVAEINRDCAALVQLCATRLLQLPGAGDGEGWRVTGCDSHGLDLRSGVRVGRLCFGEAVFDGPGARAEFDRLAAFARSVEEGSLGPDDFVKFTG